MTANPLKDLYTENVIDLRGCTLHQVLSEVEQCACGVPSGAIMEILVPDTQYEAELTKWAARAEHDFLGVFQEDDYVCVLVRPR